jgi:hypothetical protein|nr:MAG TPA: hypothetical protein [Caudoviricetes sp.]
MTKPTVKFNKSKESGNIFAILSKVREELRKHRRISEFNNLWDKIQGCKSYEEALEHIRELVDLVEEN